MRTGYDSTFTTSGKRTEVIFFQTVIIAGSSVWRLCELGFAD